MLGTLDLSRKQITIVGAGLAGLCLAERLDGAGWEVTLIEGAKRAGGLISTEPFGPGGLTESAAHSVLATPAVVALCSRLSIALEPARRPGERYIWRGARFRRFPLSPWETLRAFMRAYFVPSPRTGRPESQSLGDWARRHLGEAALRYLLTPFTRGIYGARPDEIRVAMAFPALQVPGGHSLLSWMLHRTWLRLRGKLPAGGPRGKMSAPTGGMGTLVRTLEEHLRNRLGARFRTGERVDSLPGAPNVALCVPAGEAARLLKPADAALALALDEVPYVPLVSLTVLARAGDFGLAPSGVGVLLPEGTSRTCLGVLCNSSTFSGRAPGGWVSLTVISGGSTRPELVGASDDDLLKRARDDLEALYRLDPAARIEATIHRQPSAVPLYAEQLQAAWVAARSGWCSKAGRMLFGNYTGQVSVRGMIESASALKCAPDS